MGTDKQEVVTKIGGKMGIRFDYILEKNIEESEIQVAYTLESPVFLLDLFMELNGEIKDFLIGHKPDVDRRYSWTMRLMSAILQKHYERGRVALHPQQKRAIYAKW